MNISGKFEQFVASLTSFACFWIKTFLLFFCIENNETKYLEFYNLASAQRWPCCTIQYVRNITCDVVYVSCSLIFIWPALQQRSIKQRATPPVSRPLCLSTSAHSYPFNRNVKCSTNPSQTFPYSRLCLWRYI